MASVPFRQVPHELAVSYVHCKDMVRWRSSSKHPNFAFETLTAMPILYHKKNQIRLSSICMKYVLKTYL